MTMMTISTVGIVIRIAVLATAAMMMTMRLIYATIIQVKAVDYGVSEVFCCPLD
jgi:hypothetical protein